MVTDPTQQRLINRLSMFTMMQGVIIGIMLTWGLGFMWVKHTEIPLAVSLAQFFLSGFFLLLGIFNFINAKATALRQQLYSNPSGYRLLFVLGVIGGWFSIITSAFFLVCGVFNFDLLVAVPYYFAVVACCFLAGMYLFHQRNRRAAHP